MLVVDDLLARARADHPAVWVEDAVFLAHVESVAEGKDRAALHAGDLYLACACARGVADAIAIVERDHITRIREFVAGVETSAAQVEEIAQQLRTRIFVDGRIASYSGIGSLGGWIRVAAVRLAHDLGRSERAHANRQQVDPGAIDPELGYLKQVYGAAVSSAVQAAFETLDSESRGLLKMHYVDGLTIEQVGTAFGKSRATSARMLAAARQVLLDNIRERLVRTIGVRDDEADSLVDFVRSRLDLSLTRALRNE